jgi:hypothetical protein
MDNIRHINLRRIWIFSGLFALMLTLMGLLPLLPTSSTHAAPVQGCKEKGLQTSVKETKGLQLVSCTGEPVKGAKGKETVTCLVKANGQKTTINCTGGQGPIFCTGGPAPSEKVGKEQGITEVVGKEQQTTVKGTKGQGAPITCTVGKK